MTDENFPIGQPIVYIISKLIDRLLWVKCAFFGEILNIRNLKDTFLQLSDNRKYLFQVKYCFELAYGAGSIILIKVGPKEKTLR
jgi:hypothetical protein